MRAPSPLMDFKIVRTGQHHLGHHRRARAGACDDRARLMPLPDERHQTGLPQRGGEPALQATGHPDQVGVLQQRAGLGSVAGIHHAHLFRPRLAPSGGGLGGGFLRLSRRLRQDRHARRVRAAGQRQHLLINSRVQRTAAHDHQRSLFLPGLRGGDCDSETKRQNSNQTAVLHPGTLSGARSGGKAENKRKARPQVSPPRQSNGCAKRYPCKVAPCHQCLLDAAAAGGADQARISGMVPVLSA